LKLPFIMGNPALISWRAPQNTPPNNAFRAITSGDRKSSLFLRALFIFAIAFLFVCTHGRLALASQLNVPLTIQETIYPGARTNGISRFQDPVSVGVPLADSAAIKSVSQLGLAGASAGQFRVLGRWPDGNIQWVLVDTEADLSAGGENTSVLLTDGGGNFGGPDLAADNGASFTINTGAAQFTIRKARFNLFDQVIAGGKILVVPGTSAGFVVTPTQTLPSLGCGIRFSRHHCSTRFFSSANDALSTAVLEENGPVKAVVKATGYHRDSFGNPYLAFTVRMYFYKGKSAVKVVSILRNADYGTSDSAQTSFKLFSSYEARVALNLDSSSSSSAQFSFGNSPGAPPTTGTLNAAGDAYLYQAYSNNMETCDWTDSVAPGHGPRSPIHRVRGAAPAGYTCDVYWDYSQDGYKIVQDGSTLDSAAHSTFPEGWADLSDATGAGLEIGIHQMSAYWPKSLEFMNGGSEARIGIWPDQSLFGSGGQPYISEWPQWKIQTLYFDFHASALASPSDSFLSLQHQLIARAPADYYNSTQVFFYPLPDPAQVDSYAQQFGVRGAPQDYAPKAWRYYEWENAGGPNQEDHRGIALMSWLQRGFTGAYVTAVQSFQHVEEDAFPHADFDGGWRSRPASELDNGAGGFGYPTAASLNTGLLCDSGVTSCGRLWNQDEHTHFYFMPDYYFLTGDETVNDAIRMGGPFDRYLNRNASKNTGGHLSAVRSVGIELMWEARLHQYLTAIGDSANAATTLQIADAVLDGQIYPALSGDGHGTSAQGVSISRGIQFVGGNAQGLTLRRQRLTTTFQASILLEGMQELLAVECPAWPAGSSPACNKLADTAFGVASWGLNEAWMPLSLSPAGGCATAMGGFSYSIDVDTRTPDSSINRMCGWSDWFFFYTASKYTGTTTASQWLDKFNHYYLPGVVARMNASSFSTERGSVFEGAVMDQIFHPPSYALVDIPVRVTSRGPNFLLSWTVPAGAVSYRIKYSNRAIVDWLNFNPLSFSYALSPVANQPWFSAPDLTSDLAPALASGSSGSSSGLSSGLAPAAPGSTQMLSVSGLNPAQPWHFAIKAYIAH